MGRPTVVIELATDASFARDLAAGGVFVARCELALTDECELIVRGSTGEVRLAARCVYVDPAGGAGLELVGFSPAIKEQLAQLGQLGQLARVGAPGATEAPRPAEAPPHEATEPTEAAADPTEAAADPTEAAADPTASPRIARGLHERLRGLPLAAQLKTAHSADPSERMMLERMYGKNVWEALLRNPRLTAPEVSRLARMGTLPRTLIEVIVNNGAWLQVPEIRRALLANPRLGTDQILRVLRQLPKHELKLASTVATYPFAVRDAAKRLLK